MDLTEFKRQENEPVTLAESCLAEIWGKPAYKVTKAVEKVIEDRLEAHTAQFLHQDVIDLSPRDCQLIRTFSLFLQNRIKERSV